MVYFQKLEKYLIALYEPQEDKVDLVKEDDIIKEVYIHLTPLTASQEDKQYVSLTLVIKISQGRYLIRIKKIICFLLCTVMRMFFFNESLTLKPIFYTALYSQDNNISEHEI